jgi:hypothetical protein
LYKFYLDFFYYTGVEKSTKFQQKFTASCANCVSWHWENRKSTISRNLDIFHKQLKLEAKIVDGLRQLTLFYALIYVEAWMMAPSAAEASIYD